MTTSAPTIGSRPSEHEDPVAHLADDDREAAGEGEHEHERLGGRLDEHPPERLALGGLERVRAAVGRPPLRLVGRQADGRIDAEIRGDRGRGSA